MKKLFLLLVLPFISLMAHQNEFVVELINPPDGNWNLQFEVTAINERWDENYYLTSGYGNFSTINRSDDLSDIQFDFIIGDNVGWSHPVMAVGLYKITATKAISPEKDIVKHFYMDWRTSDYGPSPDVSFKYDVSNARFRNSANTQTIDGTTQSVWSLVDSIDHVITGLELFSTLSVVSNHPNISWNSYHHTTSNQDYKIFRKIGTAAWQQIVTVTRSTNCSYIDYSISLFQYSVNTTIYYYVKADLGTTLSLPGNTVSVNGTIDEHSGVGTEKINFNLEDQMDFKLQQNYPNPFNPSTLINYTLEKDGFVSLQVYNSIGEEVAKLVNDNQNRGNYSVQFKAEDLPSGIYFYELKTSEFRQINKMLLLK